MLLGALQAAESDSGDPLLAFGRNTTEIELSIHASRKESFQKGIFDENRQVEARQVYRGLFQPHKKS